MNLIEAIQIGDVVRIAGTLIEDYMILSPAEVNTAEDGDVVFSATVPSAGMYNDIYDYSLTELLNAYWDVKMCGWMVGADRFEVYNLDEIQPAFFIETEINDVKQTH